MPTARPKQDPLTPEEAWTLYHAALNRHPRAAVAYDLMLTLGLRLNEARNVLWGDIDGLNSDAPTLQVRETSAKRAWPRTLPIPPHLRQRLLELRDKQNLDWLAGTPHSWPLVLSKHGKPPSRRYLQTTLRWLSLATIGRPIRPHTLRHTFATRLLEKTNLRVVQQALGHRSIKSTEIYTHPNMSDLRRALVNTEVNQ